MNRVRLVCWGGLAIAVIGVLLSLNAGSLATNWQPLDHGGWGGTTDPTLASTYRMLGIAALVFGFVLFSIGTCFWLHRQERESVNLPTQ